MRTLKKTLALVLVLAMMFSLCITASADFTDAEEIDNAKAVATLVGLGVIDGMGDGTFNPDGTLTRAQAAKIVAYLHGVGEFAADPAETGFADVPASHWASGYIAYCVEAGIVAGYGDGKFGPSDALTGYQWTKMLLGALGYDADVEGYTGSAWQINVAKDAVDAKLWAGSDADNKAAISRDDACQYAFNTLNAATASYQLVAVGKDFVSKLVLGEAFDTAILDVDVKAAAGAADAYGRPLDVVVADYEAAAKKDATLYAGELAPVVTYTTSVKRNAMLKDLGETKLDAVKVDVVIDGKLTYKGVAFEEAGLKENYPLSGNGILVEVYNTDNVATDKVTEYTIVVINSYVTKVIDSMITEGKEATMTTDAVKAGITLEGKYFYETSDFAKKDGVDEVIVYTKGIDEDGKVFVASVEVLEAAEVKVTSKIGSTSFNVGETKYEYAAAFAGTAAAVNAKMALYIDDYGYVIYAENLTEDATVYTWNFGYMTDYKSQEYIKGVTDILGNVTTKGQEAAEKFVIVTTAGERVTFDGALKVEKDGSTTFVHDGVVTGGPVMYSLDKNGKIDAIKVASFVDGEGEKAVSYLLGTRGDEITFETGDALLKGSDYRMTAKTVYIYGTYNSTTKDTTYSVSVGYNNAADFKATGVSYLVNDTTDTIEALYIPNGTIEVAPEADYIFFADVTGVEDTAMTEEGEETSVFKYTGYVGTELKTLTFTEEQKDLTVGLYTFVETKGIAAVEKVDAVAADADKVLAVEASYIKTEGGYEYYTANTVFYVYDAVAKTITAAEGIVATDLENTVELEYVIDFVKGADAGKVAVAYYTVTPIEG